MCRMTGLIIYDKQNFEWNIVFLAIFFYFGNETVYEPLLKKDLRSEPKVLIGNYLKGKPCLCF